MRGIAAPHVERIEIVGSVHGNRRNAEELQCARDADCDFASIGDEHFMGGKSGQRARGGVRRHEAGAGGKQAQHKGGKSRYARRKLMWCVCMDELGGIGNLMSFQCLSPSARVVQLASRITCHTRSCGSSAEEEFTHKTLLKHSDVIADITLRGEVVEVEAWREALGSNDRDFEQTKRRDADFQKIWQRLLIIAL